jgi:hypothetical protein
VSGTGRLGELIVRRLTRACLLLLLIGMLAAVGCSQPPKKMRFNNMMGRANQELKGKATAFYKVISPLGKGQPVAATEARSALNTVQNTFNDVKKDFDRLRPPVNSPAGATLLEKYRAFLKAEESILDTCYKPMVAIIEDDRAYPSPGEKWAAISALLKKADDLEREPYAEVSTAHREYMKQHKFRAVVK